MSTDPSVAPGVRAGPGAAALALLALVVLVFWPGLDGGFLFDDYHVVVDNGALALPDYGATALLDAAFSTHTGPTRRPLALLSFAFERSLFGLDATTAKCVNLVLHGINALLLLWLVRLLMPRFGIAAPDAAALAWLAVALWAVHPLNLSPVLYVVQRMTLLAGTFMLLGLIVYTRARLRQLGGGRTARWTWPAFALCLLGGLASKETAIVMLLMVAAIEAHAFRFGGTRRTWRRLAGVALLAAAAFAVAAVSVPESVGMRYGARDFTLVERLLTEARVLLRYLGMLAWPQPSAFALFHDDVVVSRGLFTPFTTLPALLAVAALGALAWRGRPRWLAFGLAWFLAGHALESTVLPLELMHEHRNYLASLGPLLVMVLGVAALLRRAGARRLGLPLAAATSIALAVSSGLRADRWSDPLSMMAYDAAAHPRSARSHYELGRLLVERARANGERQDYAAGIAAIERAAALAAHPALALGTLLQLASEAGDEARVAALLDVLAGHGTRLRAKVFRQLVRCQVAQGCRADPAPVFALAGTLLDGAAGGGYWRRETTAWLAIYYLRILGDGPAGIGLLRELDAQPGARLDHRVRLAEALAAHGQPDAARRQASSVRASLPWHASVTLRPYLRRLRRVVATPGASP